METEMKDCLLDLANTALGIELGSTRIKAVLIDTDFVPLATGIFEWENHLEDGIWTYSSEEITTGLQKCFADLKEKFKAKYGRTLSTCGAIGLSAMMHGYLPFDEEGNQLTPFRTWRNTITGEAAEILTGLFGVNIPQRWSVAHLYQAFLNKEEHLKRLAFFTTLSGFLHWKLTGIKVIGIGDASGMFPIDPKTKDYDQEMLKQFETLCGLDLRSLLPKVLTAGEPAGILTQEGALLLDPSGDLSPGIPLAPCEGDAGTGMAATNAVAPQTGNVSAGTSAFAMIVTDRQLSAHREVDMVTTPAGDPVAMVHCNNCTSDLNSWICLFREICELYEASKSGLLSSDTSSFDNETFFRLLFRKALEAEPDCGGLLNFNYISGEGVTDLDKGVPLFLRRADSQLSLSNFMCTQLLSSLATLKIGLDILTSSEQIPIEKLYGHGGFFKTPEVGARFLSAAVDAPVSVMKTAGEGGAYGMALLAAFMLWKEKGESLSDFLANKVFREAPSEEVIASPEERERFAAFLEQYKKALPLEELATQII